MGGALAYLLINLWWPSHTPAMPKGANCQLEISNSMSSTVMGRNHQSKAHPNGQDSAAVDHLM